MIDPAQHDAEIEKVYLVQAWDGAIGTIKAALALNGGASIAILAFIGSMIQEDGRAVNADQIAAVMLTFCAGLGAAALGQLFAYFTIYCYHQAVGARQRDKTAVRKWEGLGGAFHKAGLAVVLVSYGAFVCGAVNFASFAKLTLS